MQVVTSKETQNKKPYPSLEDATKAVKRLAGTERGHNALRRILDWLDDDGLGLDNVNQQAVFTLLLAAWGQWPGSGRDLMREALGDVAETCDG